MRAVMLCDKSEGSDGSLDRSLLIDPLRLFIPTSAPYCCNKDHGMCHPTCGMVHTFIL